MEKITKEQIQKYHDQYQEDSNNKKIENAIGKEGIQKVCLNQDVLTRNPNVFTLELAETKRYNQKETSRCWCFAGTNTIKENVAKNMKINPTKLELSNNYLIFFDRLEKSNSIYEEIIQLKQWDFEYIQSSCLFLFMAAEVGTWKWFASIVEKYGIVPETSMPETVDSSDSGIWTELFKEKVKKDVLSILKLKDKNVRIEELRKEKEKMLQSNFTFLSKILGEPPITFDFEYCDTNNNVITLKQITPMEFKENFLTISLNNYVMISNILKYNYPMFKKIKEKHIRSVWEEGTNEYLNLPIEEMKDLCIQQLKKGLPVWFGCEILKMRDGQKGILDKQLYQYDTVLSINPMTKEEMLNTCAMEYRHVMVLKGVQIEEGKIVRWKVEDSYGEEIHQNGYYVMNDNFFDQFVFYVVIDKDLLSEEQLKLWEEEPIELNSNRLI